jgi:hypothetical protein
MKRVTGIAVASSSAPRTLASSKRGTRSIWALMSKNGAAPHFGGQTRTERLLEEPRYDVSEMAPPLLRANHPSWSTTALKTCMSCSWRLELNHGS